MTGLLKNTQLIVSFLSLSSEVGWSLGGVGRCWLLFKGKKGQIYSFPDAEKLYID